MLILFIFFCGLLLTTPVFAQEQGVVSADSGVHFRTSPNGHIMRTLENGESFKILSTRGIWHYIRTANGKTGYVYTGGTAVQKDSGFCIFCSRNRSTREKRNAEDILGAANGGSSLVGGKFAPIMKPFLKSLNKCAPGCSYKSWGVWGNLEHQKRYSCHNSGSAIDIPGIVCNGKISAVGSAKYANFVACMRKQPDLYVIHGKGEHKRHAHISLRSCESGPHIGKIKTRR